MRKTRNVSIIVQRDFCISCGICKLACPSNAITMKYNKSRGLIIPQIEEDLCTNCGLCLKVCYGFSTKLVDNPNKNLEKRSSIIGSYTNAFRGKLSNRDKIDSSASGIVTKLLNFAVRSGIVDAAIVVEMDYKTIPRAKSTISRLASDIQSAAGSKYCPVSFANSLELLDPLKKYAIVGLPCHIYSVRSLIKINPKYKNIRLFIGLLCGGMPSYLGTEFILNNLGFNGYHVTRLEYRFGDRPGLLIVEGSSLSNKKRIKIPYPNYWNNAGYCFYPKRCALCVDGFNEFSDISCGDLWLSDEVRENFTSLVITRNKTGVELLRNFMKEKEIMATSINENTVKNSQTGLISMKNSNVFARIRLASTINSAIPDVATSKLPRPSLSSLLLSFDYLIGRMLGSNEKRLILLLHYLRLKAILSSLISSFKKLSS